MPPIPSDPQTGVRVVHPEPRNNLYFDSLKELDEALSARASADPGPDPTRHRPLPYARRTKRSPSGAGEVLVCHDFKGGYSEKPDERGYSFVWWHLIDTFVYFSHRTITIPPPGWITAAHRHGVRMLGTLILEHETGQSDSRRLVLGPRNAPSGRPGSRTYMFSVPMSHHRSPFALLSTHYADTLVQLAEENGFDGWLINIEVPLGFPTGRRDQNGRMVYRRAGDHAVAVLAWLEYLRKKTEDVLGKDRGRVIWYDSVTQQGKLAWQNSLTPLNMSFLTSSHGIFLNYFWPPESPSRSSMAMDSFQRQANLVVPSFLNFASQPQPTRGEKARHDQVYYGIDVWGRGQYGGGGFDCWKALNCIRPPLPPRTTTSQGLISGKTNLSVALFAPGWTYESSDLEGYHRPATRTYEDWWADEKYFWMGGPQPPNAGKERGRKLWEQFKETLRRSNVPEAQIEGIPGPDHNLAGRDAEEHFGIGEYVGTKIAPPPFSVAQFDARAPPNPDPRRGVAFYTNFTVGSGISWFVEGENVLEGDGRGWTDVGMTWPMPDLLYPVPRASLVEERPSRPSISDREVDAEGTHAHQKETGGGVLPDSEEPSTHEERATVDEKEVSLADDDCIKVEADLCHDDGWIGGNCLAVKVDGARKGKYYCLPMITTSTTLPGKTSQTRCSIAWKARSAGPMSIGLFMASSSSDSSTATTVAASRSSPTEAPRKNQVKAFCHLTGLQTRTSDVQLVVGEATLKNGWRRADCHLLNLGTDPIELTSFGVTFISDDSRFEFLVGRYSVGEPLGIENRLERMAGQSNPVLALRWVPETRIDASQGVLSWEYLWHMKEKTNALFFNVYAQNPDAKDPKWRYVTAVPGEIGHTFGVRLNGACGIQFKVQCVWIEGAEDLATCAVVHVPAQTASEPRVT